MKKEKTGDNSRPYKLGNKNGCIFRHLTFIFFGYVLSIILNNFLLMFIRILLIYSVPLII